MADILTQIKIGNTIYNIEPYTAYLPLSGGTIDAGGLKAPLILKGGASDWNEGLRIVPSGNWATIMLGGNDITETTGTSANSWSIHNNDGKFYISKNYLGLFSWLLDRAFCISIAQKKNQYQLKSKVKKRLHFLHLR